MVSMTSCEPKFEETFARRWEILPVASGARARDVFGLFARADTAAPTVFTLLFPASSLDGRAAADAAHGRRGTKRRREGPEPAHRAAIADHARGGFDPACLADSDGPAAVACEGT